MSMSPSYYGHYPWSCSDILVSIIKIGSVRLWWVTVAYSTQRVPWLDYRRPPADDTVIRVRFYYLFCRDARWKEGLYPLRIRACHETANCNLNLKLKDRFHRMALLNKRGQFQTGFRHFSHNFSTSHCCGTGLTLKWPFCHLCQKKVVTWPLTRHLWLCFRHDQLSPDSALRQWCASWTKKPSDLWCDLILLALTCQW